MAVSMDGTVVEIIDFIRPDGNDKNLYITNISSKFDEAELQETLYKQFSQYGLVYEVQVVLLGLLVDTSNPLHRVGPCQSEEVASSSTTRIEKNTSDGRGYYAFVKFYSAADTSRALQELRGRLYWKGQHAKVKMARRKVPTAPQPLHLSRCYDLVNHYLGFNSWNIRILALKPNTFEEAPPGAQSVGYFCVVRIELEDGLHAHGIGIAQQTWLSTGLRNPVVDVSGRGVATCRARKRAYRLACEDAFSRVLLVTVAGGKVYVEVNITVEEKLHHSEDVDVNALLTVTEVTEVSGDSDSNLNDINLEDVDLQAQRLLGELAATCDEEVYNC